MTDQSNKRLFGPSRISEQLQRSRKYSNHGDANDVRNASNVFKAVADNGVLVSKSKDEVTVNIDVHHRDGSQPFKYVKLSSF